jgi:hypothetical protein
MNLEDLLATLALAVGGYAIVVGIAAVVATLLRLAGGGR